MARATPAPDAADTVALKVTRAFLLAGQPQEVDKVVHVSRALAIELKSYGKAVDYDASAESAPKKPKSKEASE